MKDMSYRDKMIILVISIIIILVAGFFALIRPKYQALVADTNTYESTKTEWDGIKQKLDAIPDLKAGITEAYNGAKKDADIFVNEAFGDVNKTFALDRINYVMDQYLQPAIDEANLDVTSFSFGSTGSATVDYYYYTPDVVTYALLEAADINGNYAMTASEELRTSTLLEERESAELMGQNVSLSVEGTREQLMNFLDIIKADPNAVIIDSLSISDYKFEGGLEPITQTSVDAEGNEVVTTIAPSNTEEGTSALTISVTLYNAKEIDAPDFGD